MGRECRRDPAVRLLTVLALSTLILSLGPYAPGFKPLIGLPGFSFFRAPARWSLATSLALAILAGKGFDRWREWPRPGRAIRWLVVVAVAWILAVLGLFELAVWSTSRPGSPRVAGWFDRTFKAMPWYGDPSFDPPDPSFRQVMAQARQPAGDPHVPPELASVVLQKSVNPKSLVDQRGMIYLRELWETALWLVLIAIAAGSDRPDDRRSRAAPAVLLLLTFLDLWVLGRHRLIDVDAIRPLKEQSPVLARLAQERRGTRIACNFGNLPILVGKAPISAYRTLDLPAPKNLTQLAASPMIKAESEPAIRAALRATGTRLRVFHPVENRVARVVRRSDPPGEPIDDPALARWIYGADWVSEQGDWVNRFFVWRCDEPAARAWFLPLTGEDDESMLEEWSGEAQDLLPMFDRAWPLAAESTRPEDWSIPVQADGPGWVIVSQLDDPQWSAHWSSLDSPFEDDWEIRPAFRKSGETAGGWQVITVPGRGRWSLRLKYEPRDLVDGTATSIVAWIAWAFVALAAGLRRSGFPARRGSEVGRAFQPDADRK
jgi:hypothetical protein